MGITYAAGPCVCGQVACKEAFRARVRGKGLGAAEAGGEELGRLLRELPGHCVNERLYVQVGAVTLRAGEGRDPTCRWGS